MKDIQISTTLYYKLIIFIVERFDTSGLWLVMTIHNQLNFDPISYMWVVIWFTNKFKSDEFDNAYVSSMHRKLHAGNVSEIIAL